MKVVIQCAASKRASAGRMQRRDGSPVTFVADPAQAPRNGDLAYARPDGYSDDGRCWRTSLLEYNQSPGGNPLKLLPAFELYENAVYGQLVEKFGIDKVFILSAGWGLIPADFLTPSYDITFSKSAAEYKRRHRAQTYLDLSLFPADSGETFVFLGGKDYLPLFASLTHRAKGQRVVFYNSKVPPGVPRCTLLRYETTTRTNWHYECARALIEGRLVLAE